MHKKIQSRRLMFTSLLSLLLFSFGSDDKPGSIEEDKLMPNTGTVYITAPSAGSGMDNTGTLTVSIYADGNPVAVASNIIGTAAVTTNISATVKTGLHSFRLIFEYTDSLYGDPFQLAVADSETINIPKGSDQTITFSHTDFSHDDLDNDSVTNLGELYPNRYTDPVDSTCIANNSILAGAQTHGCTLG